MLIGVTGATDAQGGAAIEALLAGGHAVRALVRDPGHPAARLLAARGVELAAGCFEEPAALDGLARGADALFSVQLAPTSDPGSERRQARALIEAGQRAGIAHLVQASVSHAGAFRTMAGWAEGRWPTDYWESKGDVEAIALEAGFRHTTILRPAFMMDNFALPKAQWMFPDLAQGRLLTAVAPETRIALIAASDIGAAVAAAVAAPERFAGVPLEMAGDWLSLPEIAAVLSRAAGRPVKAEMRDAAALVERGQSAGWVSTQQWLNVVGYPARPAMMAAIGLAPSGLADWAAGAAAAGLLPARCG